MLHIESPRQVKPICGFIYAHESAYETAKKFLVKKWGKFDYESAPIDFTYTDYYCPEMGKPLFRRFVSFCRLRDSSRFVPFKLWCVGLERKFASGGRRTVNIDPGYINEAKLVLLTTKDYSHRIHLGRGIYAEVTLQYRSGGFQEFSYTFPDYRTDTYKGIFNRIRQLYRDDLRQKTLTA